MLHIAAGVALGIIVVPITLAGVVLAILALTWPLVKYREWSANRAERRLNCPTLKDASRVTDPSPEAAPLTSATS